MKANDYFFSLKHLFDFIGFRWLSLDYIHEHSRNECVASCRTCCFLFQSNGRGFSPKLSTLEDHRLLSIAHRLRNQKIFESRFKLQKLLLTLLTFVNTVEGEGFSNAPVMFGRESHTLKVLKRKAAQLFQSVTFEARSAPSTLLI